MELQNEVRTDKTVTMNDASLPEKLWSAEKQSKVYSIRKILIILIGLLLVLCLMNFVLVLQSHATTESREYQPPTSSSQLISILISFVCYGFGFLVTYRYYQTGLLVFAWLGFVSLLLMFVTVIIILVSVIVTISHLGFDKTLIVTIIFIVICLIASLLQIFIVRYAFILSKLLRHTKLITTEEMQI